MEKLTAEQLIKIIQDNSLQAILFDLEDLDYSGKCEELMDDLGFEGTAKEFLKSLGLNSPTEIDYRCDTSEMWTVIYFPIEDIYLKLTGTYDSYGQYEHDYDDEVTQVFPKQVTVTIYEEK